MSGLEIRAVVRRGGFTLDLDLRLGGGATGVFGPSGSGKSTLLHAIAGLLPSELIRVAVDGEVLVDLAAGVLPPAHRRRVGLVFQDHRLFPHLSVQGNLCYGMVPGGSVELEEVVDLLELGDLLDRLPRECSGGQRQRVAIGRALLAAPRVLLLDEPLSSLDRGLKLQVLPFLRRVQERFRLPTLMVSHDLSDLLALTDELLLMDGGRAAGQGDLPTIAADQSAVELLAGSGLSFSLPGHMVRRDRTGLGWVALTGRGGANPAASEVACGDVTAEVGDEVEVILGPADIVLAVPPMDAQLSLTNHLAGTVERVTRTEARCLVQVDCGLEAPVLAEVTERAVERLALTPGAPVVALFKAQATRARGLGAARAAPPL
ncbi:MAG: molybdenum ABC transporter ATP-binding protein [Planctomycetes bacterium]|nr:molybdenum ABC transporter ATP-binding protein [Planctomycetota bacterium]